MDNNKIGQWTNRFQGWIVRILRFNYRDLIIILLLHYTEIIMIYVINTEEAVALIG